MNAVQITVSSNADTYSNTVTSLPAIKLSMKIRRFGTSVTSKWVQTSKINPKKTPWFFPPIQLFTQGQWWSNLRTQRSQHWQWRERYGRRQRQSAHIIDWSYWRNKSYRDAVSLFGANGEMRRTQKNREKLETNVIKYAIQWLVDSEGAITPICNPFHPIYKTKKHMSGIYRFLYGRSGGLQPSFENILGSVRSSTILRVVFSSAMSIAVRFLSSLMLGSAPFSKILRTILELPLIVPWCKGVNPSLSRWLSAACGSQVSNTEVAISQPRYAAQWRAVPFLLSTARKSTLCFSLR